MPSSAGNQHLQQVWNRTCSRLLLSEGIDRGEERGILAGACLGTYLFFHAQGFRYSSAHWVEGRDTFVLGMSGEGRKTREQKNANFLKNREI